MRLGKRKIVAKFLDLLGRLCEKEHVKLSDLKNENQDSSNQWW